MSTEPVVLEGERFRTAHEAICRAGLPPSTELIAHRLLQMADGVTGQINMTWEQLSELTGCENVNAARRHLSRLAGAELVHYSTNDYVYVTWLAWMRGDEAARPRAGSSAPARRVEVVVEPEVELFGDEDAPVAARGRAGQRVVAPEAARGRAGQSHARLLVSQSVDPGQVKDDRLTDMLAALPKLRLGLEEQRRSVALLTDAEVGIDTGMAWHLAQRQTFDELARQVMTWKRQLEAGIVKGSGALVKRIVERFGATITSEDRKSALYRRHHPNWREEEDLARREQYRVSVEGRYSVPDDRSDRIVH